MDNEVFLIKFWIVRPMVHIFDFVTIEFCLVWFLISCRNELHDECLGSSKTFETNKSKKNRLISRYTRKCSMIRMWDVRCEMGTHTIKFITIFLSVFVFRILNENEKSFFEIAYLVRRAYYIGSHFK